MTNLSSLKRTSARSKRRVGRGQSSTRGKTSGRGTKGQNARAGRKKRPELRDLIKKLPKRRGFGKNRGRTVFTLRPRPEAISLALIESRFDAGAEISPKTLMERGMVPKGTSGIKLIGNAVSKKFTFKQATASASAKAAIEKAGGSIA